MIEESLLTVVVDDLIAICQSQDGLIDNVEQCALLHKHNLLSQVHPPSIGSKSRLVYMATLNRLRNDVHMELARRGMALELEHRQTKDRLCVHRLMDGAAAGIARVRAEPASIVVRSQNNIRKLKRFLAMRGLTLADLPEAKQESLLNMLKEEAKDASRSLDRRYSWALEFALGPQLTGPTPEAIT